MNAPTGRVRGWVTSASREPGRRTARLFLVVWAFAVASFVLLGPPLGESLVFAQASPSPTGTASPRPTTTTGPSPGVSPGPTGPGIAWINPSVNPAGNDYESPDDTPPDITDKQDVDETYHLVAGVRELPSNPLVEAYIQPVTAAGLALPEQTIGLMEPVPGTIDTYELNWDVPESLPEGNARLTVRLYQDTALGTEEIANNTIDVELRHKTGANPPSGDAEHTAESIELTWPTQNGPLGFYKPVGGAWRTYIDVFVADVAGDDPTGWSEWVVFYYTKTPFGRPPVWIECGNPAGLFSGFFGGPLSGTCTLAGRDLPRDITAIQAVVLQEVVGQFNPAVLVEEGSDAHRVQTFDVDPPQMKIALAPYIPSASSDVDESGRALVGSPTANPPGRCLAWRATVTDQHGRRVPGANIDVHMSRPSDQLFYGEENPINTGFNVTEASHPGKQKPQKGPHADEAGHNCNRGEENPGQGPNETPLKGVQGDQNVPAAPDIKHIESTAGTGLSGGTGIGQGQWGFLFYSPTKGLTDITAWIDDESIADQAVTRPDDTDTLEPDEPMAQATAQWLGAPILVTVDPAGATSSVGTCVPFTVKVRSGVDAVPGINVDVHATGPNDDLDFCTPQDGSVLRKPDQPVAGAAGAHDPEDEQESSHAGSANTPRSQHTEGETNGEGNFVFGLVSPVAGDTTLQVWVDGEPTVDNDTLGTTEPNASASVSWASCEGDAELSFVNPSGYGGAAGSRVSAKLDADRRYHIVTRVDCAANVSSVEILVAPSGSTAFTKIGDAPKVGGTDTFSLDWDVTVADGNYRLRAQIAGTNSFEERDIVVNNQTPAPQTNPDPAEAADETVEMATPSNGATLVFDRRRVEISGTASDGANAVDLFYTKSPAKDSPESAAWVSCGFVPLTQPGGVQSFKGTCELKGSDQPHQVTGVAALTVDCNPGACQTNPSATGGRQNARNESGDAHRVFGVEADPIISLEPAEAGAPADTCQKYVVTVRDQSRQPIAEENIDVHLTGPAEDPDFCDPGDGSASPRNAPDQGGHLIAAGQEDEGIHDDPNGLNTQHTEGRSNASGRFVFGISSAETGDSQLLIWLDRDDDDAADPEEKSDTALMHWERPPGSCTIQGTAQGETIEGTSGNDVICAGAGNDRILAGAGDDIIRAGRGSDRLFGGDGFDQLFGRSRADVLRGGTGDDRLEGGNGRDRLNGGEGIDTCFGGRGRDRTRACE